jgi:MscS family membrane protein
MKTPAIANNGRWMALLRSAALFVLGLLLVGPALAQSPLSKVPRQATSAQQKSEDQLGRSTPRGTVLGFIRSAKEKDYALAAQYLDTREKAKEAEELARQLQLVLNRGLKVDIDKISRKPEGDLDDESRPTREMIGAVTIRSGKLEILLDLAVLCRNAPAHPRCCRGDERVRHRTVSSAPPG